MQSTIRMVAKVSCLALVIALIAGMAFAQTSRGTVTGTVSDATGAVVVNATVTLMSPATGVTSTTKTNHSGIYRFEAVLAGQYEVTVDAPGFARTRSAISVAVGLTVGRDFALEIAKSGETIEVSAAAPELQTEQATRAASLTASQLASLPIVNQSSLNLMLTVPGVVRSNQGGALDSGIGSVNGARARSNNFMIDGTLNNDISVAGPSFSLTNNDAIQEVSVQTSNFTAEFGRAGGAVVNQVTKSGGNAFHGTLATVYRSQLFNASTNFQRQSFDDGSSKDLKNKFKENIPAFTFGGPVIIPALYDGHNKTFFFVAGQWDRYSENSSTRFSAVPTEAGVATLTALAGTCPNVAKFLDLLGPARGTGTSKIDISLPAALASTSCGGGTRTGQFVQYGAYNRDSPRVFLDNNHLVRIDHTVSQKQSMMFRWLYDKNSDTNGNVGINPAFDIPFNGLTMSGAFNDVYAFRNNLLNEFRFNYTRYNYGWFFNDATSLGATTPDIAITSLSNLAVASTFPQGRIANSFQYQDTLRWNKGKHSLSFGGEILRQVSKQVAPFNSRGQVFYGPSTEVKGLANFIDNFAGQSGGPVGISFGSGLYRPSVFTWTLFAQDSYKLRHDLTLNYGLRYENFGQSANQLFKYKAFVGYSDADILSTADVKPDNNNFGPSFGFAWSPEWKSGIGGFLAGDNKLVVRGGYMVSYDTWFDNLLSNMAAGSPNALANQPVPSNATYDGTVLGATPRGTPNVAAILPSLVPVAVTPKSNQTSIFDQNIRNPYYHRFSFGIQRELPSKVVMDLSYVGSLGRQLFYTAPLNPTLPNATNDGTGLRLHSNRGLIQVRDSGLTSNYNAMQFQVRRAIKETAIGGIGISSSWTWSKNLDVLSETFASNSSGQNPSRSPALGIPLKQLDYGPSDNDRRHVVSSILMWNLRGPKKGVLGQILGGWSVSPVVTLQTGTPFTVLNGSDRDLDGSSLGDRAQIGNINAPLNTYALSTTAAKCASRLITADGVCVTANDVHFYQILKNYNPVSSQARNSNRTHGYVNMDANILKTFKVSERFNLEYRAEIFDLTNTENFDTPVPSGFRNVTAAGTNFLDYWNTVEGTKRTMRMGLKVIF